MPNAWLHATVDLIVYGKSYFDFHKNKDAPSQELGKNHRRINHQWYQVFGKEWSFDEPFPNTLKNLFTAICKKSGPDHAEEQMAYVDHDYIDRIWDVLPDKEKLYWEGFFIWVLSNTEILKNWAGVDVINGKIQRTINNEEIWEKSIELKSEYKRLRQYVEVVKKNNPSIQNILKSYGDKETNSI